MQLLIGICKIVEIPTKRCCVAQTHLLLVRNVGYGYKRSAFGGDADAEAGGATLTSVPSTWPAFS
jgi:hypothetical protein